MNKLQKWLIRNVLGVKIVEPGDPSMQTRMYSNAVPSRFNQGFPSFNTSEDLELVSSLRNLRARSRSLIRDAGYAQSACRTIVNNVIGTGIRIQPAIKTTRGTFNDRINTSIDDVWSRWMHAPNCHTGGSLHFHDMERMCMAQVFTAGEIFLRIHRSKFGASEVPIALEVVEPERIVDGYAYPGQVSPKSGGVRMGIETDKFKKPIAYWIRDLHPGDIRLNLEESDAVTRVDAVDVIHIYVIDRWPQTRGIPWMHAAAEKIQDVNGYSEAEIIAARGAASYLGTIESPEESSTFATQAPDNTFQTSVEPGIWMKLNPGEKANFVAPNRPTAALDPFMRYMLREIAAATGVSYEALSHDYSQSNYSSARLSLLNERDIWKALQQWWIRSFRQRLHHEWIKTAVMARAIPEIDLVDYGVDPHKFHACNFRPRGWTWVDPAKEVAAYVQSVKSGFRTVGDVIAETGNGADLEEMLHQRAAELKFMKELELSFDTSPDVYVPAESRGQVLVNPETGLPEPAQSVTAESMASKGLTPPAGVGTPEVPGLAAPPAPKPMVAKPAAAGDTDEPVAAEPSEDERKVTVNLTMNYPTHSIRVEPRFDLSMQLPKHETSIGPTQVNVRSPDVTITNPISIEPSIVTMPAPNVTVEATTINVAPPEVRVQNHVEVPSVHVAAPEVFVNNSVAAPEVTVQNNVAAPTVNVAAPDVRVVNEVASPEVTVHNHNEPTTVNVAAPDVRVVNEVPVPVVHIAPQELRIEPPVVRIEPPVVNVAAPVVTFNSPEYETIEQQAVRDDQGRIDKMITKRKRKEKN